jgi:hypothetical protein
MDSGFASDVSRFRTGRIVRVERDLSADGLFFSKGRRIMEEEGGTICLAGFAREDRRARSADALRYAGLRIGREELRMLTGILLRRGIADGPVGRWSDRR